MLNFTQLLQNKSWSLSWLLVAIMLHMPLNVTLTEWLSSVASHWQTADWAEHMMNMWRRNYDWLKWSATTETVEAGTWLQYTFSNQKLAFYLESILKTSGVEITDKIIALTNVFGVFMLCWVFKVIHLLWEILLWHYKHKNWTILELFVSQCVISCLLSLFSFVKMEYVIQQTLL